jgi:hypothetical protein
MTPLAWHSALTAAVTLMAAAGVAAAVEQPTEAEATLEVAGVATLVADTAAVTAKSVA